jgi:putative ABC transport system permease protein
MLTTTLKGLAAHKLRLLTTAIAVMLGVAFMSGTLVLTDTLGATFDDLFADANDGTDAYVRADAAFESGGRAVRDRLDAGLLATVASVDGVDAATGRIQGYAQLVDADGDPVGDPMLGAPTYGENWVTDAGLNPWTIVDGTAPVADDEVVINRAAAEIAGVAVGDTATVLVRGGPRQVTVAGTATFAGADSMAGATTVFFTDTAAQALVTEPGRYDGIAVRSGDLDEAALAAAIDATLPDGVEVITGSALTEESQTEIHNDLQFINTFLLVFAVIALLVGAFIIFNTFSITVAQRSRELAVLRAIGASRRQVMVSVLLEAVIVGLLAAAAGLAAGIGVAGLLKSLLAGFGVELPDGGVVVSTGSMVTSLAVGVVITLVAAIVPARKASRIPPVAAMRDVAIDTSAGSRTRIGIGAVIAGLGAIVLASGLSGAGEQPLALVGGGAVLVFLGVAVLGPVIARPVSRILGAPLPVVRGVPGLLAKENAARSPKRTAATASALMIGVGLVGFITIVAASTKASIDEAVTGGVTAEYVVQSGTFGFGGLDPSLAEQLHGLPEVDAVSGVRFETAMIDGTVRDLIGFDSAGLGQVVDFRLTEGSLGELGPDGLVVILDTAEAEGWGVGTVVPVTFADGARQDLTIRAIHDNNEIGASIFTDTAVVEPHSSNPFDMQVFISVADDVAPDRAHAALTGVTDQYPNAELQDRAEFAAAQSAQIDPILGLVYALLGLAVLIAVLGIANTLALSIFERTRELGLLRSIGMTRAQVRSTVRWESVIIALLGTGLGLVIGIGFGWAVVDALASEGITKLVIPAAPLAVITALAALAGTGAAILPARRAARLDVLEALQAS